MIWKLWKVKAGSCSKVVVYQNHFQTSDLTVHVHHTSACSCFRFIHLLENRFKNSITLVIIKVNVMGLEHHTCMINSTTTLPPQEHEQTKINSRAIWRETFGSFEELLLADVWQCKAQDHILRGIDVLNFLDLIFIYCYFITVHGTVWSCLWSLLG